MKDERLSEGLRPTGEQLRTKNEDKMRPVRQSAFILPPSSFIFFFSASIVHPYLMTPRREVSINCTRLSTSGES